jgi:hypothetical protein
MRHRFIPTADFSLNHKMITNTGILEFACDQSPYNFDLKIALITYYKKLFAHSTVYGLVKSMNIQHI